MFTPQEHLRPINTYPTWKYAMLVILLVVGFIFALPNIYPPDPAIQITQENGSVIEDSLFKDIQSMLVKKEIKVKSASVEFGKSLVRFNGKDDQFKASSEVSKFLAERKLLNHVVAINLAPTTPDWLRSMGGAPLNLGLDLRGGVQFLMQVDMESAMGVKLEQYTKDIKKLFRDNKLRYSSVTKQSLVQIVARFRKEEDRDRAEIEFRKIYSEFLTRTRENGDKFELVLDVRESKIKEIKDYAVDQNIATFRNRINELGVAEPLIQKQGSDRILVQLPGVQDSAQAKRILGKTATLEFRMVKEGSDPYALRAPAGTEILSEKDGTKWVVKKKVIVSGTQIVDATSGFDSQTGQSQISVKLDSEGGAKMLANTTKNTYKRMAIVMIETKAIYERTESGELNVVGQQVIKEVVSAPSINGTFGSNFQVTGSYTPSEASEFALILRAGSLIAPTFIIEERTIGPSLGEENIRMGMNSILVGFIAVLIFMLVYYKLFGLIANLALLTNLIFIVAIMSLIPGATLTLPGIAGIVLTVGMAVDANVLIFERIREELAEGVNPAKAIHAGYDKAFSTIADANITTLIAAMVLFGIGTGPIAGFAVTLLIGILTSMFTAIVGTRAVVNLIYGGKSIKKLSI
ncbi:MAG: protein translocase subunit SecD [Gammaproteobacteria bacterium]|nr:MAG: protein translocase subunit SecD [Gammaproteobacteria bacterium]